MRRLPLFTILLAALALVAVAPGAWVQAAGPSTPRLVAIRAAHHPGFDRVVFEFRGGMPELGAVRWTREPPTLDPSGLPSGVQGDAFLSLVWFNAVGHQQRPPWDSTYGDPSRAYDLPNVTHVVNLGDWEATLSFAIGVMRRPALVRITTLSDPVRTVVDLGTAFERRTVKVWFLDTDRITGDPPYVVPVTRQVPHTGTAQATLQRLFAGPTRAEQAYGLRFVRSEATGFTALRISDRAIARVQLTGGCDSYGSSLVTIASELMPTLRALPRVDWVKVYDPDGTTERPFGLTDSIPACLEP
jgi:hypothetical protein